jgi:hypothetical protein
VIQHIYLSTNSGEAWGPVSLSSSGVDGSFPVAAMKDALFAAGGTWLMGTSTGWLAKSSNAGLSWTLVLYNRVEWLLADGNALYAGTNHSLSTGTPGVFLSTDRGTTWSDITAGLPPPAFQKCPASAFVVAGDRLFAGTRGSGVWRRPLLEVLSTSAIAGGPARQIALHQSYPNPFNGSSDIGFEISDFANVRLQVFDLLGREVALLVNAEKGPGVYHTQWDASGVPSGVYFCRMTTGTFHQTVKMVLSR